MNCQEWRNGYTLWLSTAEAFEVSRLPQSLAEHMTSCPDCRCRHETFAAFYTSMRRKTKVSDDLSRRVMSAVMRRAAVTRYRRFPRPAVAAVAAAAAAVLTSVVFLMTPLRGTDPQTTTVRLAVAAPQARSVTVAGDWNAWNPKADPLTDENGDGVWEIELHLKKNREYRYQFIINGESWIPDPRAVLHVEDGFGGTNSVLDI